MKFPRIPHLPWSPGGTNDDKRLNDVSRLLNKRIIITEKMDGSNLCLTRDAIYARSHSGPPVHKSFDLAKALHAQIRFNIGEDVSVYGEWCYAQHSICYDSLPDYFLVFAVEEKGIWWEWDLMASLDFVIVPKLFDGMVGDEGELRDLTNSLSAGASVFGPEKEGVVVRVAGEIKNDEFHYSVAKWVREGHIQTDEHWLNQPIKKQGLNAKKKNKPNIPG